MKLWVTAYQFPYEPPVDIKYWQNEQNAQKDLERRKVIEPLYADFWEINTED